VVIDASSSHIPLLLNSAITLRNNGTQFRFIAHDDETQRVLTEAGFTVFRLPFVDAALSSALPCNSPMFRTMLTRLIVYTELVMAGIPFWLTDSDTIYFQDPRQSVLDTNGLLVSGLAPNSHHGQQTPVLVSQH